MERISEIAAYVVTAIVIIGLIKLAFFLLTTLIVGLVSPKTPGAVIEDLRAIRERDPAAEGWLAAMFYPGWWALTLHRLFAHPFYKVGLRTLARLINFGARFMTGADIHPGAQLGRGIFIDHAHGVVIGETAIVGNNVTILHQVTLGGTGKESGKRHPTVEDGVLISAGSKILGNIVIGENAKVGAGSVVVKEVPADSTVVGVPGRIVATRGKRVPSLTLDQTTLPDPVVERIVKLQNELKIWEDQCNKRKYGVCRAEADAGVRDVLAEIVENKRTEVEIARTTTPLEPANREAPSDSEARPFYSALSGAGLALIAEIKKASPSGGLLREDFEPVEIAKTYLDSGASALSILTDQKYFQGSLDYLKEVRAASPLPILRKDFIIDEYQIVEAAQAGAHAVLLIVACLDDAQLKGFREAAEAEGMDALVEVHDEAELERALNSGVKILGINNRNLKTLKTTLDTTRTLVGKVPRASERNGMLLVSESGIRNAEDTACLSEWSVDAVLIGETFMRADDIGGKVREVMGIGDYVI